MAVILRNMRDSFNYVFYDLCDERTKDYFPSAQVMFTIIPLYVYFSIYLGPRLMKDVKPFKLKTPIFYYNLSQIFVSAYIVIEALLATSIPDYSWVCQPVDWNNNPSTVRMANAFWVYTVVKLIDLMDTVFFVLRKKDRQISFLHVFHHAMMPIAGFVGLKYFPNGQAALLGIINSFVHVVMYTYYLISGLGPKYQKYLWWKKHLTTLQLVQFSIIFLHQLSAIILDCGYPKWISCLLCIHSLQFIYMFGNFYYVNYIKNSKEENIISSVQKISDKTK